MKQIEEADVIKVFLEQHNEFDNELTELTTSKLMDNLWLIFIFHKQENKDKRSISKIYYTCTYKNGEYIFIKKEFISYSKEND